MDVQRRQRGTVKSKLTRLETKIDTVQRSEQEVSREHIEVYAARLEEIRVEFDAIQREIIESVFGEPTMADATADEEFEDRYLKIKIRLKEMLTKMPVHREETRASDNDDALIRVLQQQAQLMQRLGDNGASGSQSSSVNNDAITQLLAQQAELLRRFADGGGAANNESKVRLPIVKLPSFDGRTEDWKRFSETFQSLIHNNDSVPRVQKFQYLISSLSGVAAKLIESIELTHDNYIVAWDLLVKRYDDPRAIKKKHIQCLFSMPRVEKESSIAIRELVDYTQKHLRILKAMELPTDSWNELIVHMMEMKLDQVTLRAWEQDGNPAIGTLENMTNFLQARCQILERIEARSKAKDIAHKGESDKQFSKPRNQARSVHNERMSTLTNVTDIKKCYVCQGEHFMYRCDKFLAMSVDARLKEAQRLKLCINCLRNDHFVKKCRIGSCKECSGRHNTLLHRPTVSRESSKEERSDEVPSTSSNSSSNVSVHHASNYFKKQRQHVIMATAMVNATRSNGATVLIRILLDSASEANFVTQSACNMLGIKRNRASETVTGLNKMESQICQSCDIEIQSKHSNYRVNVRCLVVPTITKNLPSVEVDRNVVKIPSNIKLADIEFHKSSPVDMLLGAEFFFDLLEAEKINLGENRPILQNTKLGWVVAGSIAPMQSTSLVCNRTTITTLNCSLEYCETLNKNLEKFWELENVHPETERVFSVAERQCEEFFEQTTTRDANGRFVVRLPFRDDPSQLGTSRDTAVRRLAQLERRFKKNEILRERYVEFMREYQNLDHMSPVNEISRDSQHLAVYLPHHGVIKESSSSTKLRTVFDASSKTSSGVALNDILHVGPTLQGNLVDIMIRFRFKKIALTGDLRKMYRQITIHPNDRDFQRILWRQSPNEPIQEFQLNTVTYGEASSSYLAIKCIRQLAEQAKQTYPNAARVILDEMYVDDIMTGADSIQEIIELQGQLTELMLTGGFEIHKWCSNRSEGLVHLPAELKETVPTYSVDTSDTVKTLGLEWRPNDDNFQFAVQQTETVKTKRQILSAISKFFDPLGLIGPILTTSKLFMQGTWRLDCGWDEPLPAMFSGKWEQFRQDLNEVESLIIPRRVIAVETVQRIFLQGFCDASEAAYGACVYVQVEDENGGLTSRLLCSKSRVAPIKVTSIPRLELCSAVLLAQLLASVQKGLRVQVDGLQAWSDSTVALCWIRGDISRWKTFVANRVAEITQILPSNNWNHIRGEENPADLISRGASPRQLKESDLWWSGPHWLQEIRPGSHTRFKVDNTNEIDEAIQSEERKIATVCNHPGEERSVIGDMIERSSSMTKLERVLAYCIRFVSNLTRKSAKRNGQLQISELQEAQQRIIKNAQAKHFAEEILALKNDRSLKMSSKLLQLQPFLDDNGVLRVGGRLQRASVPFAQRHPILLPAGSRVSKLIFEREHRRLLHASQLLLLSSIRERYWPLNGRDLARQTCRSCVWCARNNPRIASQIMGSLPSDRVQPSRPFTVTGVDFAGPITTLVNKGRGRKTNKSYVALFVCFSTRAIHLEATTELTSAAFIATLRRFIGRRGRPRTIYSDNGTNFVGANRELKETYNFVRKEVEENVGNAFSNENIEWKFIPPSSPHMGGLWEAGVKSCKYHLKRVMGNALFTFEELTTTLVQIEACLNSRPMSAMSNDPMDLHPLTPAHFLVGESLTGLPDIDITEVAINRLSRWQRIQRVTQDFWKRWAAEYITTLQGRTKWKTKKDNLTINDLVIVREENISPLKWKLGRITELHPGSDGLVRVATLRVQGGIIKRSIAKLCKLPVEANDEKK